MLKNKNTLAVARIFTKSFDFENTLALFVSFQILCEFENHLAIVWIFSNLWDLKITPKHLSGSGKPRLKGKLNF